MSQSGVPSTREPRRFDSGAVPVTRPGPANVHVRVVSASHVGRVRAANEDACTIVDLDHGEAVAGATLRRIDVGPRGVLLAVSDGMGGARDGAVASAISIDALARALEAAPAETPAGEALEQAARDAHREVWEASCRAGHRGHTRMGATLTALLVRDGRVTIAQVGDSRAYLIRQGTMTRLTNDQSIVQSLIDKGLMKPEDAEHSPMRNILTQAMGHQEELDVVMSDVELRDRDCLLVCSDGLTNELGEDEIRDAVLMSMRLDVAAKRLVDLANERGGRDNVTVVLAGASGSTLPPSSAR